jgi:uncharacterized protein YjiS (DUF1127 family)
MTPPIQWTYLMPFAQWLERQAQRLAAAVAVALHTLRARRRRALARAACDALDDAALRDLGLHRSEFDSCWAEAHGHAAATRRRIRRRAAQVGAPA